MIERQITACVELTPEELAAEFANMDSHSQAEFFNALSIQIGIRSRPLKMQISMIANSDLLQYRGRDIMRQLGECAGG